VSFRTPPRYCLGGKGVEFSLALPVISSRVGAQTTYPAEKWAKVIRAADIKPG
jgi:hypothetical protein